MDNLLYVVIGQNGFIAALTVLWLIVSKDEFFISFICLKMSLRKSITDRKSQMDISWNSCLAHSALVELK